MTYEWKPKRYENNLLKFHGITLINLSSFWRLIPPPLLGYITKPNPYSKDGYVNLKSTGKNLRQNNNVYSYTTLKAKIVLVSTKNLV